MAGGYDAFDDPYAYKGATTLKNKLGLRDPAQLEAFELEMTTLRAREPLPRGAFDAPHYRRVHRHLFQDVYSWAGKYRTVRTAKGGRPHSRPMPTAIPASQGGCLRGFATAILPAINVLAP